MRASRRFALILPAAGLLAAVFVPARNVSAHDAHDMGAHMTLTPLRPIQPGDQARADAIVVAARKAADRYTDYKAALADGYTIFMAEMPQNVYHFTRNADAIDSAMHFDPAKPTSLLYDKVPAAGKDAKPSYKLVGVMYTAPYRMTPDQLDQRIPLSIAQWHLHTNLCVPLDPERLDPKSPEFQGPTAKFGLQGSIATAAECQAVGGYFIPHLFGWMVHVYPYEKDPAKVWTAGMDDDHGMQDEAMPAGMKM